MRLSLLIQREPFGEILEQTLTEFLHRWTGQPHTVRWYDKRPRVELLRRQGQQPWLGNIYLNAIFTPGVEPSVFDPIRREFARSVTPWRCPLQRAYVSLATSRLGAPRLAQVGVGISPALPNAEHLLIVPGNHKIRILDRDNGIVYNIAKHGFPAHFMQHEIATRRQAESLGLPVPALKTVAEDQTWFSEQYISGTPLNRLSDPQLAEKAKQTAINALNRLLEHTAEEVALEDYVADLHAHIQTLIDNNHLLSANQKQTLMENAAALAEHALRLPPAVNGKMMTALTHGDFQPGNILVDGERVWLIDWEYSARRQVGYDGLVLALGSRFPKGLAGRMQTFVTQDTVNTELIKSETWPDISQQTKNERRVHAMIFLLEEVIFRLEEIVDQFYMQLDNGLMLLESEIILGQRLSSPAVLQVSP